MNSTSPDELLALLALTCTPRVGLILRRQLIREMKTASAVYEHRTELPELLPGVRPSLVAALDCPAAMKRAEVEMKYIEQHHIHTITIHDEAYPSRLRECDDAPLVLYYCGNANLNARHVVSIVGTRKATEYGRDLCTSFLRDLSQLCPDVLVVSGLAYGIDVAAHRASLTNGLSTVGVLAHGLDRIYPSAHRSVAAQMADQGGLLTEYMSFTEPERQNFVQRNRIVAGMTDAVVVVESASHGGALITADLGMGYHRDVYAFPGRVGDEYSIGCNQLIRSNSAALITSAADFVQAMGWATDAHPSDGAVQRQLFVELTPDEERVLSCLRQEPEGLSVNLLVVECDIPINRLTAILFSLEMKGVVRSLPGARYRAIN